MRIRDRFAGDFTGVDFDGISKTLAEGLNSRRTSRTLDVEQVSALIARHMQFARNHDRVVSRVSGGRVTNNYNGGRGGDCDWLVIVTVGREHRVSWSRGRAQSGAHGKGPTQWVYALLQDERDVEAVLSEPGSPPSTGPRRLLVSD